MSTLKTSPWRGLPQAQARRAHNSKQGAGLSAPCFGCSLLLETPAPEEPQHQTPNAGEEPGAARAAGEDPRGPAADQRQRRGEAGQRCKAVEAIAAGAAAPA